MPFAGLLGDSRWLSWRLMEGSEQGRDTIQCLFTAEVWGFDRTLISLTMYFLSAEKTSGNFWSCIKVIFRKQHTAVIWPLTVYASSVRFPTVFIWLTQKAHSCDVKTPSVTPLLMLYFDVHLHSVFKPPVIFIFFTCLTWCLVTIFNSLSLISAIVG